MLQEAFKGGCRASESRNCFIERKMGQSFPSQGFHFHTFWDDFTKCDDDKDSNCKAVAWNITDVCKNISINRPLASILHNKPLNYWLCRSLASRIFKLNICFSFGWRRLWRRIWGWGDKCWLWGEDVDVDFEINPDVNVDFEVNPDGVDWNLKLAVNVIGPSYHPLKAFPLEEHQDQARNL